MIIVFDLDNTIIDEFGSSVRPGIIDLLDKLKKDNHNLILWTNSKKERATIILRELSLNKYFDQLIFREDYDPNNEGIRKDIRKISGDVLIDDDPKEVNYLKSLNEYGLLISPFRKGLRVYNSRELEFIYKNIKKIKRNKKARKLKIFLKKLFSSFRPSKNP